MYLIALNTYDLLKLYHSFNIRVLVETFDFQVSDCQKLSPDSLNRVYGDCSHVRFLSPYPYFNCTER